MAEVPSQRISALEAGRQQWTPKYIEAVATALNVSPRDLLPGPPETAMEVTAEERALVERLRRDGWPGVARAVADQLAAALVPGPSAEGATGDDEAEARVARADDMLNKAQAGLERMAKRRQRKR